jgi:thioredoxin 1
MASVSSRQRYAILSQTDLVTKHDEILTQHQAPWCSQCKAIAPFVENMTKKYPEVRFYNYNTDTADDISQELGANQMPTFHLFKDGDLMGSVTGAKASAVEKLVKENYDGKVVEQE